MKQKKTVLKRGLAAILGGVCAMGIMMSSQSDTYVSAENMRVQELKVTVAPALKMGDVNFDGKVDLSDAQLALNAALNIIKLSPEAVSVGDINGNGYIDQADAQSILRLALAIQ